MQPDNIRFVLVETSHPGNIGAAARAMKTMGLRDLRLVKPKVFPHADATQRASGADDVLHASKVHETLKEAIAGCEIAIATSARPRELSIPEWHPGEAAAQAAQASDRSQVAVIFGRERWGLSNEELDLCQALIRIPTVAHFSSLNIASAVQLLAYEIRMVQIEISSTTNSKPQPERVGIDELEGLYSHFESALEAIGYYDPANPKRLMRRLRRLFARAGLEPSELKILRGILTAIERTAKDD